MKKFLSFLVLLCICISQFHIGMLYAAEIEKLSEEKQKSEQVLTAVETIVDVGVEKMEKKIKNKQTKENLQKKNEEIKEYLEEVKQDIQKENSTKDIQEKVEEAKKVVVLKVVAGTTEFEDTKENIPNDIARNYKEKKQAVQVMQDSLKSKNGDYSIIIRTKYSESKVRKLFDTFDSGIVVQKMYELKGETYFEVFINEDSIFRREMLEDIESGILPEKFIGIQIVLPEVFGINEINLSGENISQTWGIEQYKAYNYFSDFSESAKRIRVGVVDTGIDYNHSDLKNNVNQTLGKDFVNNDDDAYDDQGHGTHVAGTIAANINGSGIIGVNPYVELVPLKICTDKGFCPSYAVIRALEYAKEQKIDILNMSLGGRGDPSENAICGGISSVVESGGIVVAASGNSNIDTSRFVPGGCSAAITVAAVDSSGKRAVFSNYGSKVDVAAPGVDVYSTIPVNKGSYKKLSGTSMATPHIVGLVSLLQVHQSDISVSEIRKYFSEFGKEVSTDAGKDIAKSVDVSGLLASLHQEKEIVEDSLAQEEISQTTTISEYAHKEGFISLEAEIGDTAIQEISDTELTIEDVPEIKDTLKVLDFDLGGENEEGIEIKSFSGDTLEEVLDIEIGEEEFYISSGNKTFDGAGRVLDGNTQINSNEILVNGEIEYVGEDFNFLYISELPDDAFIGDVDAGVEINNLETDENELQEIFLEGAEKGVKINSAEEEFGEELIFSSGASVEEVLYDEEGNIVDISQLEKNDVLEDKLDFSMDDEVFIDGAQASVEINNAETSTEIIEIEEFNSDMIIENLDEDIPEDETFERVENNTEAIQQVEETSEVFVDGAQSGGIEINSSDDTLPEEVIFEEFSQEAVPDEEFELGEIPTPEDFVDEEDGVGEDEIIEGTFEEYIEEAKSLEEGGMGIQNTYSCEIYPGQSCSFRIYKSYRYQFTKENPEVSTHASSKRVLYIHGKTPGFSTYNLYRYGRHYHTIYVTVKQPPKPQEFEVNIVAGNNSTLYFPDTSSQRYRYSTRSYNGGNATLQTYRNNVNIRAYKAGKVDFYIRGNDGILKYIVHTNIIAPPPPVYESSVYEGKNIYINGNFSYEITSSQQDIVDIYVGSRNIKITGKKPGFVELYFKKNGIHEYTYKLEVKSIPEPKIYDVKILEGHQTILYLPRSYYRIYRQVGATGRVSASIRNGYSTSYVYIRGYEEGSQQYFVYDNYGFHRYTLNINISIKEPIIKNISLYEGKYTYLGRCKYSNLYGQSDGITRYYKSGSSCFIQALKYGETQVLMKSYRGGENYLYKVQVKAIPTPKEYNIEIKVGGTANVYLPEAISLYQTSYEGDDIFRSSHAFEKHFSLKTQRVGSGKIILKNADGYAEYIIHITSQAHYKEYTIHLSDRYYNNSPANYNYRSQDTTIAYQSGDYLYGRKIGETEIYVSNSYGLQQIWKVKVLPKPEPKIIKCEISVGERCSFTDMRRTGQYLYQSKPGMLDINWYRSSIKVDGEASGNAKIYIRSRFGDYISHILEITVHPVPPRLKTLTMMVGNSAETNRWIENGYTYKTSKPEMLRMSKLYNTSRSDREGIKLTALNAGEIDLYVYENGDHTLTYRITILPQRALKFPESSFSVGEGKEVTITLEGGYAPYSVYRYNEKYTNIDVSKHTGVVGIKGIKKATTYAIIEDAYGQQARAQIIVKETQIETDVTELTLAPGETKYVSITDYVGAARQLFRSNNNLRTYLESYLENGERVYKIRVEALYSGKTLLSLKDYKTPYPNQKSIAVTVTGDVENPDFKEFRHPDAIDGCPNGDYSGSTKDGLCGEAPAEELEEEDDTLMDIPDNISDTELDELLKELFAEFGIQSVESEEGIEMNSYTLTQDDKNKYDQLIYKLISREGEKKILALKSAIPKAKQKWTSQKHHIILDYISESIEKQIEIKVIHSIEDLSNGNIGGLEFQVLPNLQGKISNIGVKFTNELGQAEKQELTIRADGKYIVAFSQDSCSGCKDFEPYYLISGRTDEIYAYSGENIEVANSSYNQFANILKSIWNWRGYTKKDSIQAIVDIKEDYDDYVSLAVSLFPGVGEVYDVGTLVLGKDPITGEELGPISKAFTIAGLLSGLGSGKAAREAGNVMMKDLASELNLTQQELESVVTEVIKDIDISSVDDLVKFKESLGFKAISDKVRYKVSKTKSTDFVSRNTIIGPEGAIVTKTKDTGFISMIRYYDGNLMIADVDKGRESGFFMSDIILEQIKKVGGDSKNIKSITIDNVINKEVIEEINIRGVSSVVNRWGEIGDLDKMTKHLIKDLGKDIQDIKVITDKDIYGRIIYDISINLE